MSLTIEHRLRARQEEIFQIEGWVREFCQAAGVSAPVQHAIDLSLVEWLTNVISYGYSDPGEHWITVRLSVAGGEARVEVEDDGREFDPLTRPPVDTSIPLEQRSIGGLGIHMIRQFMDGMEYRREAGRNRLTMRKRMA